MKTEINKTIPGYEQTIIMEDDEFYYINLRTGMGESKYPKEMFELDEAIFAEVSYRVE